MDKINELQNKLFFECQSILENLSKIETKEELISKQELIYEITERISFIKLLKINCLHIISNETPTKYPQAFKENNSENTEENIEKEVAFTNELNNIEEHNNQEIKSEIIIPQEVEHIQDKTKIENEKISSERKLKLSTIKGTKPQSLFEEDILNQLIEEDISSKKLEESTQRIEFKLDLNDRIAFSKMLFNGSQLELNEIIKTLNSFNTIDEAKEYLSDVYYERNWDKVDEYAQRLWTLVESKFL